MKRRYIPLIPFLVLAMIVAFMPVPVLAKPTTRTITITAEQFAYDPPVLHVNRGDHIIITLQSADVMHGFYLDGYNLNAQVAPGEMKQLEFIADRSGKFRYRCSVSCGPLHPFMIGELVVEPNLTFARAIGLMGLAMVGTFVYLRQNSAVEIK